MFSVLHNMMPGVFVKLQKDTKMRAKFTCAQIHTKTVTP